MLNLKASQVGQGGLHINSPSPGDFFILELSLFVLYIYVSEFVIFSSSSLLSFYFFIAFDFYFCHSFPLLYPLHMSLRPPTIMASSSSINASTSIELTGTIDTTTHRHIPSPSIADADEATLTRHQTASNDPYSLSRALKSPSEISLIKKQVNANAKANIGRKRKHPHAKKADGKKLKEFYEAQNEKIEKLLKSVEDHRNEAKDTAVDTALRYKIAVYGSLAANICLSAIQVFAAVRSGSLSLFASMKFNIDALPSRMN
ncbi:hypothetical protein ABW19_dt0201884 [Dactylella cylindrospora]|nr:hypothetical protein ABW19_dt0201884 [Dactylella cylindrospora]